MRAISSRYFFFFFYKTVFILKLKHGDNIQKKINRFLLAERGKNIQPKKNDIVDNTVTSCCYNCSLFEVRNWAAS